MNTTLVILILLATLSQAAVRPLGKWISGQRLSRGHYITTHGAGRIIGGTEVPDGDQNKRKFQVGIFIDTFYFCGGSLIHKNFVLTAAHCVFGKEKFEVYIGSRYIAQGTMLKGNKTHVHEGYDPVSHQNDIALIELESSVEVEGYIVELPKEEGDTEGTIAPAKVVISGWGLNATDASSLSSVLLQVELTVEPKADCLNVSDESTQFCTEFKYISEETGDTIEKLPCFGDAGGPLTYEDVGPFSRIRQVGILSYMSNAECQRAGRQPLFTKVHVYWSWIDSIINPQTNPSKKG